MAKKVLSKSGKKKNWYSIVAPKVFNEMIVGETSAVSPTDIVGRTVKSSLMTFTRNMKKQGVTVTLKLTGIQENKAMTEIDSYVTNPSSIKRLVRRRRDKIDDSFICKTKDNKLVRVKPMMLTRSNTSNSVLTSLRHVMRYMLIMNIMKLTYGQFVDSVLNDRLVKDVKKYVNVVYPVRMVSIRAFEIEENPKARPTMVTVTDKKVYDLVVEKLSLSEKKSSEKQPIDTKKSERNESTDKSENDSNDSKKSDSE